MSTEHPVSDPAFFTRDPVLCARELIGAELVHGPCRGRILETEAYRETGDPACHLFTRPSARTFALNHPPGTAYVYLNYGVHWLVNVLCRNDETGESGFVLFRALEATEGLALMKERRGTDDPGKLCSGPGKLTAALGIDGSHHGRSLLGEREFFLESPLGICRPEIVSDLRVGISAGKELPWRFLHREHPGVSVPAGKAR